MNKTHLIEAVAHKTSISSKDVERATTIFFQAIAEGLLNNDRAELRGFGTFKIKRYEGYIGRNPKSGTSIEVKAKKLPIFKPAKELRLLVDKTG
jgi:integration host factor subunit beta